jgi:hypothetical protein
LARAWATRSRARSNRRTRNPIPVSNDVKTHDDPTHDKNKQNKGPRARFLSRKDMRFLSLGQVGSVLDPRGTSHRLPWGARARARFVPRGSRPLPRRVSPTPRRAIYRLHESQQSYDVMRGGSGHAGIEPPTLAPHGLATLLSRWIRRGRKKSCNPANGVSPKGHLSADRRLGGEWPRRPTRLPSIEDPQPLPRTAVWGLGRNATSTATTNA